MRRAQFGQSLTISDPLTSKLTLSGEIWHFTQPFLRGNAVGNLWAVSYAARKTLVFDAGFNHGLTDTSTRWEAFVGLVDYVKLDGAAEQDYGQIVPLLKGREAIVRVFFFSTASMRVRTPAGSRTCLP